MNFFRLKPPAVVWWLYRNGSKLKMPGRCLIIWNIKVLLVPQLWSAPIMKWRFSKPADIGTMLKPISNFPGNGGLTIFNRQTWTKTCNLRNNYFTSSDPRPDTYLWLFLTYHLEIYIYIWYNLLTFYSGILSGIYSDIFWHPIWHPLWHLHWHFLYLRRFFVVVRPRTQLDPERMRWRSGGERRKDNIKSNKPHLTGGEE